MGSSARLWALVAACALAPAVESCAINPQPEPPGEAEFNGGGGATGDRDAGFEQDAPAANVDSGAGAGGAYTGGSGGAADGGAGGDGGTNGGTAGTGGSSNPVVPGAFDDGYADDDDLTARLDAKNETDSGVPDARDDGAADAGTDDGQTDGGPTQD